MDWFNLSLTLPVTDPTWIFLLVLLIILFAPILLNKLRIPHIIGMILAGLVIGEHGFNILVRDSSFELFGKVGLYYIMFLAGLEMNMGDFKKNRGKAVMLGLLAFIIPIGIGLVTNMMLLKYSLVTSVLLASMYASHTLVAYPIVIRYGVSRHRSVSIAVGGTAVTDTLTLLVLAVVGGLFKGESGGLFWLWLLIKVVFLGALIMYSFPRIGRWFFRRYDDNVMQFIFVLAMVFLGAGLMEFVGMEGILGAFLAGLVLNRLIPHVSPLMNHLEFVGNALFIPYFLIGVGMLIDIHVIFGQGDALKVAAVMITVALVGKWIASWLTQKIYKMAPIERELMFGLSNAQAAATLAAVLVGYNIILPGGERLLNEDVLNGTVLLILVTCVVSSFITERAARKIAMCEAHLEEERTVEAERILIPIANPDTIEYLMNLSLLIRDTKQKDNLLALNVINDNNTQDYLISGEVATAFLYTSQVSAALQARPDLEVVYPKEGLGFGIMAGFIPSQAPNADAAYAFLDYINDPENAAKCYEYIGYYCTNKAAEEYISDDMKKMIVLPEDAAEGEIVQNISQEAEDLHAEIWNQFKSACN